MNDTVEVFQDKLSSLINQSNLPLSVISVVLNNALLQINVLKLQKEINILNDKYKSKEDDTSLNKQQIE